jgi:hypothetical protein
MGVVQQSVPRVALYGATRGNPSPPQPGASPPSTPPPPLPQALRGGGGSPHLKRGWGKLAVKAVVALGGSSSGAARCGPKGCGSRGRRLAAAPVGPWCGGVRLCVVIRSDAHVGPDGPGRASDTSPTYR